MKDLRAKSSSTSFFRRIEIATHSAYAAVPSCEQADAAAFKSISVIGSANCQAGKESRRGMKRKWLLTVMAIGEAMTGAALLVQPSVVAQPLVGLPPSGASAGALVRIAGVALLALGTACGFATKCAGERSAQGLIAAMLIYNLGVPAILGHHWLVSASRGAAELPVSALHLLLAIWCAASLIGGRPTNTP